MQPDESVLTNGKPASRFRHAAARTELDELRATCRRQERVIDSLSVAGAALRRGALALKAENARLRVDGERRRRSPRPPSARNERVADGEGIEVRLALDAQAPGAARRVLTDSLGARVKASTLDDARLLVSELVANSLNHSGASADDDVVVRVELTPSMVSLEVEDPGRGGMIVPRAGDVQNGGGYGLNIVQTLSERWGVERVTLGGTTVWAQLART